MGLFNKLRKKALANKAIKQTAAQPLMGKKLFGMRLPSKEMMAERMPIGDMRFRDPRFEDRGGIMNLLRSRFGERPLRLPRPQMQMDMAPQPISQAPSGIGSLPNIDIQLPSFLQNIPSFMPQFDFSNIPQLPENFQFSPQFGGMVPGFAGGMDVNAIDRSPEQMIFALDQEANILLGEAEAQARGGNLDKANEMYRQVEAINNQIANMKGEIGDQAYMQDLNETGILNVLRANPERVKFSVGGLASAARALGGRFKDLANTVMGRNIPTRESRGIPLADASSMGKPLPYQGMIGTKAGLSSGKFGAVPMPRIPGSGMVGPLSAALGGAGLIGAANYPEEFGALVARGQITYEQAVEAATQKLGELGQIAGETLGQAIGNIGEASQASAEEMAIIKEQIRRGYEQEIARQRQKEIEKIAAEDKPIVPVFAGGGGVNMDETIVTAPRVKVSKPTGFEQSNFKFLSSDPLADEEQSQLLSALSEEGSIQEMIESLLADRGRTLSDMDIMMLSQIFAPKKSASMV